MTRLKSSISDWPFAATWPSEHSSCSDPRFSKSFQPHAQYRTDCRLFQFITERALLTSCGRYKVWACQIAAPVHACKMKMICFEARTILCSRFEREIHNPALVIMPLQKNELRSFIQLNWLECELQSTCSIKTDRHSERSSFSTERQFAREPLHLRQLRYCHEIAPLRAARAAAGASSSERSARC